MSSQYFTDTAAIYRLFKTVCGMDLLTSSCALTFCSPAVSASICFCCWTTVVFNSSTTRCCFSSWFAERGEPAGATPSWPFASTTTRSPVTATPAMLSMKQLSLILAPNAPIQITLFAVVTDFGKIPPPRCQKVRLPLKFHPHRKHI